VDQKSLDEKIRRPQGVCTSVANKLIDNMLIVGHIMGTFSVCELERASRTADDWEPVTDLPMNFETYRYRVKQ
jgi:hypothetical protein